MALKQFKPFKMPERPTLPPLPVEWEEYYDEQGYLYYYNATTEESTYDRPLMLQQRVAADEALVGRPASPRVPKSPRVPDSPRSRASD
jgi:hypothetical protein